MKDKTLEFLETLVDKFGYKLIKKENQIEMPIPENTKELDLKTETELKIRIKQIEEEKEKINNKLIRAKTEIITYLQKQGPTEITKRLFSGTGINPGKIFIYNDLERELDVEREYIDSLITEITRKTIMNAFKDFKIGELELVEGPTGYMIKVKVE